jgi:hypothetical protein
VLSTLHCALAPCAVCCEWEAEAIDKGEGIGLSLSEARRSWRARRNSDTLDT